MGMHSYDQTERIIAALERIAAALEAANAADPLLAISQAMASAPLPEPAEDPDAWRFR